MKGRRNHQINFGSLSWIALGVFLGFVSSSTTFEKYVPCFSKTFLKSIFTCTAHNLSTELYYFDKRTTTENCKNSNVKISYLTKLRNSELLLKYMLKEVHTTNTEFKSYVSPTRYVRSVSLKLKFIQYICFEDVRSRWKIEY